MIDYKDIKYLKKEEERVPLKFEKFMAILVEILFGLIGIAVIYFGKAITYGIYQIYIYVAFLIYRKDISDFKH